METQANTATEATLPEGWDEGSDLRVQYAYEIFHAARGKGFQQAVQEAVESYNLSRQERDALLHRLG